MPIKKYLEIDSTYRNRNMYPNPGSFTVNIAQGITKSQLNALDPVSNAFSEVAFNGDTMNNAEFTLNVATGANPPLPIIASSSKTTLILTMEVTPILSQDYQVNYLSGFVLSNYQNPNYILRRIISSKFLQVDSTDVENRIMYIQVEIDNPIPDLEIIGANTFTVYNPTTIGDTFAHFFLPTSKPIDNYYNNFILYNKTKNNYGTITSFDGTTHMAKINDIENLNWELSDVYEVKKEPPSFIGTLDVGLPNFQNSFDIGRKAGPYCINSFLQCSQAQGLFNFIVVKIIQIIGTFIDENKNIVYTTNLDLMTSYTNYVIVDDVADLLTPFFYEFLSYSYDNSVNFSYSGSMVSLTQPSAYEVSLNSICFPNIVLQNGGYIWQYPFVYVELENVSSSSNSLNLIYSNNPNSNKAVFKVPIINTVSDVTKFPFLTFTGNDMTQTITIKPNSDMRLCIKLPNGSIFTPLIFSYLKKLFFDTSYGQAPDPSVQVSVVFSFQKV
jgi:hypothetical protein